MKENLHTKTASTSESLKNPRQQIKATLHDAEHLARVRDFALLIIDAQEYFCAANQNGRKAAEDICTKIGKAAQQFRQAAVQTYAIYWSDNGPKKREEIDFCNWEAAPSDILVDKCTDSAFNSSNIHTLLRKNKKKKLLVCGFNTNACVASTVVDALRHKYEVYLMKDLTENSCTCCSKKYGLDVMEQRGAKIITSKKMLAMMCGKR